MDPQFGALSIKTADRQSLLKAWAEFDLGYDDGPVDYLWLFYTVFYTAKGMERAKTFYVSKLSIWKESGIRLSFFHEYLVATVRSINQNDKREYYLLFERTAGELNREKKSEEDIGQGQPGPSQENKNAQTQEKEQGRSRPQRNGADDITDFSFVPDRDLENRFFGRDAQRAGQQSDDEGGPKSASSRDSMSPKSGEAISGMLEMFLAAKDSVSHASESSSADFILANDRYQLLDRPCRRPSDTEVAWMMLAPPGDKDPPLSTPVPTNNPVGDTVPNTPLSRTSRRVPSLRDHAPGILHRSPSQASSAPDNTSRMSIHRSIPTQSNTSLGSPVIPDHAALTRDSDQLGIEQTLSRSVSNTSSISYASRTSIGSHAAPSAIYAPGTPTGASHTSLPVSEWPINEEALSRPSSPPTHLHELPFAHSIIETVEVPTPGPHDKFLPIPGLSLETITTRDTPLLKIKTNMTNRSTTSILSRASSRLSRTSRSTARYDAQPLRQQRPFLYLYELVVLACRLHKCTSLYRIFTRNCYWFAGMMFHVVRLWTQLDALISGEGDAVDRMKPSVEVMLWINSGRVGTFLRSIRIVKAPRLFTIEAVMRKWNGAVLRFEDQVGVNSADNTPQAIRIIQMAMRNEERKREAAEAEAIRMREAAEEEGRKVQEEREEAGAEKKKMQDALEAERRKGEKAVETEKKKLEEETRRREEETRRREEETRRREEETRRREEAEEKAKEYEKILQQLGVLPYPITQHGNAQPESPTTPPEEVDGEEAPESPAA